MNTISPLAFIHPNAKIGDNNIIGPFCYIDDNTVIGDNNKLLNSVTIHTGARIGNGNEFFPGASISTKPQDLKFRGEDRVEDYAIISASVLCHQFCNIGCNVMIQGGSRFSQDIPPYIIAGKEPIRYAGINIIGLRRKGFTNEQIDQIHNAYRLLYGEGTREENIQKIKDTLPMTKEIQHIIEFVQASSRGIIK